MTPENKEKTMAAAKATGDMACTVASGGAYCVGKVAENVVHYGGTGLEEGKKMYSKSFNKR
jgi:hypothetical protein